MKPRSLTWTRGRVEPGNLRVGPPADRDQHAIEQLLAGSVACAVAFEA